MSARVPAPARGDAGVDEVLDRFRERGEVLRVWSVVITIFGDAAAPRGGVLGMQALQAVTTRLGIGPNALRTAMSRLAADGWLERQRRGRLSYYALASPASAAAEAAARRIYASAPPPWHGGWLVCIAANDAPDVRERRRARLADAGFRSPRPDVYLRPDYESSPDPSALLEGCAVFEARTVPGAAVGELVGLAWPVEPARSLYLALTEDFCGVDAQALTPLDAMAMRTLLVHQWRRALLKDADLPAALRPQEWPGEAARSLVTKLYGALLPASERWLDRCGGGLQGALPSADRSLRRRFAAAGP